MPDPFRHLLSFLLILSILITILFPYAAFADDAAVLAKLAASLSPVPSDWTSTTAPCKWKGITCDNDNRVTVIDIKSKSLSGVLPIELFELTELKSLFAQDNALSGRIPDLNKLVNLEKIYLDHNKFTSIGSLKGLSSLQELVMSDNDNLVPWMLSEDLLDSKSLRTMNLGTTNLFGVIPEFIGGNFSSLEDLRLSYNNLTGGLPESFRGSNIVNLWLNNQNGTYLTGGLDVLGGMTGLRQVWLHKNGFTGGIPDLSNCTSLFDLQLRDNRLTGVVPPSVMALGSLKNVSLDNNKLQGPYPVFKPDVTVTGLSDSNGFCKDTAGPCDPQVTALLAVAGGLGYPMKLAESWKGNDACNATAAWVGIICTEGKVTRINFASQHYSGIISPEIANLTSLVTLNLNDNSLTGEIPASLANLKNLTSVDVSNNNLVGKIPDLPNVKTLKTSGNPLLGNKVTPPPGSNTTPGGSDSTSPGTPSKSGPSAGKIAGIVIAVVALVVFAVALYYWKYFSKRSNQKFNPVPNNLPNGAKVNGYGGGPSELHSQSSGENFSDVQYFEGGYIAISIQLLRQVTGNFSETNILGKGGFGVVYKGILQDGTQIAVKRMESGIMGTKGLKEFEAEIAVLSKVRHRHLVALLGYCVNGNERLLVYEYMPQGTLSQHLFDWEENRQKPLTWKERLSIALDVARGVEYLHSLAQQSFIHRDLKPSNILLGDDMRAKVSDFGLVKNAPDGKYSVETRLAGTFGYLAPEYAATGRVTRKVDVYAYGVVLMEMITGRKALDEQMPEEKSHLVTWFRRVLIHIEKNLPAAIDPTLHPDDETYKTVITVANLAGHCTARDPSQRPDMGHAVNILGPLVEQWKPSPLQEEEEAYGNEPCLDLNQHLRQWKQDEGTSTTFGNTYHRPSASIEDTTADYTGSSIQTTTMGPNSLDGR